METIKKVILISLIMVIIVSSGKISLAESEDNSFYAEALHELGLFDGVSTTEFEPALDKTTNREQAMKMIAVALKWDIDMNKVSKFTDVSDWAQPYVAKAVELGITSGIGDNQFGGTKSVLGKEVCTWLLRALGVDAQEAWNKTDYYVYIYFNVYADSSADNIYNRGELVKTIYTFISQKPIGGNKTLIDNIIGNDEDLRYIARMYMLTPFEGNTDFEAFNKNIELTQHLEWFGGMQNAIEYMDTVITDQYIEPTYLEYSFIPAAPPVEGAPIATETNHDAIYRNYYDGGNNSLFSISFDVRNNDEKVDGIYIFRPGYFTYEGYSIGDPWTKADTDKYYHDAEYFANWFERSFYADAEGYQYMASAVKVGIIADKYEVIFNLRALDDVYYIDEIVISSIDEE